jgi:YD repeat-containing protein
MRVSLSVVLLVVAASLWPAAAAAQGVSCAYDALGRLIAVTDPAGDTAIYTYDATGNLLSITRHASSTVAVIAFTPTSGGIGTTVTVSGTGFSATAGQNTVSFNGTTATITSASPTRLVVTVPSGATTGVISVTAPGGNAQSADDFVVGTGAPTITGFSPTLADVGATVTITGTNFDPVVAHNRTTFNAVQAFPGATSTTTQLVTPVPTRATSGHLRVATAAGEAVSAGDFFVPPPPLLASAVVFTGRTTVGSSLNVPITPANKIALVIFDAAAGQRVNVKGTATPQLDFMVIRPTGAVAATASATIGAGFSEPIAVPVSGTYSVVLDPIANGTGTTTVTVYDVPPDVSGTIPTTGASTAVTITAPGQNARLTFAGTTGQRVSLKASAGPAGPYRIASPTGATVASAAVSAVATFIDATTLGQTGTFAVEVDPTGGNTGSVTLNLYDVPADLTGTITPGGSPVALALTTPGQNGQLSFGGTTGQRISLAISTGPTGSVVIKNPDGSTLASGTMGLVPQFIDTTTLAQTGTFTMPVDPSGSNAGTVTLTL